MTYFIGLVQMCQRNSGERTQVAEKLKKGGGGGVKWNLHERNCVGCVETGRYVRERGQRAAMFFGVPLAPFLLRSYANALFFKHGIPNRPGGRTLTQLTSYEFH